MFELNLASLPNHILYLEGVQLSYIKVYVHIFNLWHSNKPCFISNPEFCKRTGLHRDTVINALQFFEKHKLLKRVQKGNRRYLVQCTNVIETETEEEKKPQNDCTNIGNPSELDHPPVGVRPPHPSELDHHNNKYNNKIEKSFFSVDKPSVSREDEKKTQTPNNYKIPETIELCQNKKLDLDEEFIKFKKHNLGRAIYPGLFLGWLNNAKDPSLPVSKNEPFKNEPHSTVIDYGPGHPTWEAQKKWDDEQAAKRVANESNGSGTCSN